VAIFIAATTTVPSAPAVARSSTDGVVASAPACPDRFGDQTNDACKSVSSRSY
jgi:hypothetical protein